MMKHILSLVIAVAVVGFINAQQPAPISPLACTTYPTNSTEVAFCFGVGTYSLLNTTNVAAANTAAQSLYNSLLPTNSSEACQAALKVYACQSNLPRCGRYQPFAGVAESRCAAVTSSCGIASNATTCIRNALASVEGQYLVCVGTTVTTLGSTCATNLFDPTIATPASATYTACPYTSACNTTASTPFCAKPSTVGDSCGATSHCINLSGFPGTTMLECLGGKCTHRGKRFPQSCTVNEECRSLNCTSGVCLESQLGEYCMGNHQCRDNLWCDSRNATCYNVAVNNEQCDNVQPNWSPVPCISGYSCVRLNASDVNSASFCRPNAEIDGVCSERTSATTYDHPLCDPIVLPIDGVARCVAGVCRVVNGRASGQQCNGTVGCERTLTCKYDTGATNGVCTAPGDVACDNVGGSQCQAVVQRCACSTDSAPGTCTVDNSNPIVACHNNYVALQQCLKTKCVSQNVPYIPYDAQSCAQVNCAGLVNAYFCCAKAVVGANFVTPKGAPEDPCTATPTPSATPTSPVTTGSNTPTPTPSRSGAATVAISFVAMIVAVVAFCL